MYGDNLSPMSKQYGTPASSLRTEPLASRPDIGNTPNMRQINMAPPSESGGAGVSDVTHRVWPMRAP